MSADQRTADGQVVGTVGALWRYPVKSMLGERVPAADVTERGLNGDRRLALLDRETGKVASAKNPRLWRELLTCAARLADNPSSPTGPPEARITAPDGRTHQSTDPDIDDVLSAIVGRPVTLTDTPPQAGTLERSRPEQVLRDGLTAQVEADEVQFGSGAPPGTFFDFAPLHLISTSTLKQIGELSPRGTVEVERYRPNLVIDTQEPGFVDHAWVGRLLHIGNHLTLRVLASTPRCAIPTLAHGTLPRDTFALRTLATHNRVSAFQSSPPEPAAGVYTQILHPGPVRTGDVVRVGTE
jgi:uncharacterized protein YcbX